jgi:hypothetical protein
MKIIIAPRIVELVYRETAEKSVPHIEVHIALYVVQREFYSVTIGAIGQQHGDDVSVIAVKLVYCPRTVIHFEYIPEPMPVLKFLWYFLFKYIYAFDFLAVKHIITCSFKTN